MTDNIPEPRLYMSIGNNLKEKILSKKYPLGDKLPSEKELSKIYNASRTVIRESVIMLEVEGYIKKIKGSGIFVTSDKPKHNTILSDEYAPFELLQARQEIESTIAALAAKSITKSDAIAIKQALKLEKEELDQDIYQGKGDYSFHISVAKASQNQLLLDIVSSLWKQRLHSKMWAKLNESISDKKYANDWISDHEAIFSALIKRDSNLAREEMWQHLENVKNRLYMLSDSEDIDNCFLP